MELKIMSLNKFLEESIVKSQRCQRNWNLNKSILIEDIETMKMSVTQCMSKQNRVFYKVKFITNRDIIEKIHDGTSGARVFNTEGVYTDYTTSTNSQTLANLVVAFCEDIDKTDKKRFVTDASETDMKSRYFEQSLEIIDRDKYTSVGIASAYLTLTANMLGYSTGCCQCFDEIEIGKILKEDKVLLIIGIGYSDENKSRLEHHISGKFFPSISKTIDVEDIE